MCARTAPVGSGCMWSMVDRQSNVCLQCCFINLLQRMVHVVWVRVGLLWVATHLC